MLSQKTSGCITRGRFISPSTIAKWVHSMPGASRVIDAMETFNGVVRIMSEQPVALLESNQRHNDIRNLVKPAQPVSVSVTSSRISGEWCCGQRSCQLRRCSVLWRSVHEGYERDAAQCNPPAANEQCPVISKCDEVGESTRRGVCFNPTYWFHRIVCIVRSEEELLGYLTYELVAWLFSMIALCVRETNPPLSQCYMTWHPATANHHRPQCSPLIVVIFDIDLFGSIHQGMDR